MMVKKQTKKEIEKKISNELVTPYRPLEAFVIDDKSLKNLVDVYELGALNCSYNLETKEFCDFVEWSYSF